MMLTEASRVREGQRAVKRGVVYRLSERGIRGGQRYADGRR